MTDAVNANFVGRAFDRARLERVADWLAVAVVVVLPWSTSAALILIGCWFVALAPTLSIDMLRREVMTAAGGLPILLVVAAAAGMLWSNVSFAERFAGFDGFLKLLVIPLLLAQFRRSRRGMTVLYGFLMSCVVLLIVSWGFKIKWDLAPGQGYYVPDKLPGIPVRDYIAQSAEFLICAFGLLAVSFDMVRQRRFALAAGAALLALLFIFNITYISPGRTALVVIPVLILIFGLRRLRLERVVRRHRSQAPCLIGIAWAVSPFMRLRVLYSFYELDRYRQENVANSTALRIEFWKKSIGVHRAGAGDRARHRLDARSVPTRGRWSERRTGRRVGQSAQSVLRGGHPARVPWRRDPDRDVDRAPCAVPWIGTYRVARHRDCGAERRVVAVQLAFVRFPARLALCVRPRRGRRHGAASGREKAGG
jgi:hypothetical protein